MKIITSLKEFFGSRREKVIASGSALVVMPFVLYAEGYVSNTLAMMDPDLFGPGIEEVIEVQDQNFKSINETLFKLSQAAENDDKTKGIIAVLSKNIESTQKTNNKLTKKLDSMYKDRERLRSELQRTKGGDLIPNILVSEGKSVNFKDAGIVSLTDYHSYNRTIIIRYSRNKSKRVNSGEGVSIKSNDNKVECIVTYLGGYDDKFGLEKNCIEI